jgi:hypothetical protein
MSWQARNWLLVVAALFLVGFVANVVTGKVEAGNTAIQWLIATTCIAAYVFVTREARARASFVAFLHEERDAIRAGTAQYRGQPVSYATRVRTCQVVLSFLLVSVRIESRPLIVGARRNRIIVAGSCIATFVFGWWGIPWGPLWSARAIANNLRGKPETSVGELLEGGSAAALPAASTRA